MLYQVHAYDEINSLSREELRGLRREAEKLKDYTEDNNEVIIGLNKNMPTMEP